MKHKKAPGINVASALDDHQRFASFILLLMAIDKRTSQNRKSKNKKTQLKKDRKVRIKSGPCFYWRLIYHVIIDFSFCNRDYHDRYISIYDPQ